ncbi:MAG: hypothetical protein ABSD57_02025 [Verrucomicrobiota bacterium]|jgi:hypothetical protein
MEERQTNARYQRKGKPETIGSSTFVMGNIELRRIANQIASSLKKVSSFWRRVFFVFILLGMGDLAG